MKLYKKILLGTAIMGCGYLIETFRRQSELIQNSKYGVNGVSVRMLNIQTVRINGNFWFQNDSVMGFDVNSYNVNILLDGKNIGTLQDNTSRRLESRSVSIVPFAADINILDVIGQASAFGGLPQVLALKLALTGALIVNNSLFFSRVPIDITYTLQDLTQHT